MKFNIKDIEFSRYDKWRNIKIPEKLTPELAELIGIIMGDGNITMKNQRYIITIFGDLIEDSDYHQNYVTTLFKNLFNINPLLKKKIFGEKGNCRIMITRSKAITSFFVNIIGLPNGKKDFLRVPKFIFKSDKNIIYKFLRGLADTDFTIKFKTRYGKKNYYPIIIGNFSCKEFVNNLKNLLKKINFHSHIENRKKYDKKRNKIYRTSAVNIVGIKNTKKWMKEIGFANKRHIMRYNVWKKLGYCPPYTNIRKAELILKKR
ncbi:hypothetical protein CMI39_02640 [Candidatus Pacearchaeota archaeon]|jgi:intein/homing endonuclease|nr:hypothetical protein [Candidatus Pacearchaeota archaeon]|tara:strand:+ start:9141 stop:9923 length:783 start_codon:yes stop_codon:yes gene_type:complete